MGTTLPITPTFVLPHKRYATFDITDRCRQVLEHNKSLRKAVAGTDGRPIFKHEPSGPGDADPPAALSHSTLWRWLTFLGTMTITLQCAMDVYLQANPNSSVQRFEGNVDPRRARSEERQQTLSIARRLLNLERLWSRQFLTAPFFTRMGTFFKPP